MSSAYPNRMDRSRLAAVVAVCLGLCAGEASAQPAPSNQGPPAPASVAQSLAGPAKKDFEIAMVLFNNDDFGGALLKFERALELSKDPRIWKGIALCEKSLRRYTRARRAMTTYLSEGLAQSLLSAQQQSEAEVFLAALKHTISDLKVTIDEPGADVFVDGEKVGVSPLSPVPVDLGSRQIRVSKPGFKDFVQTVQVPGLVDVVLSVKLVKDLHQGRLVVEAGPKDVILLDGKPMAQGRWEGVIASGEHTIRVTAPGMLTYQSEVVIQDDKTRRIPVTLEPVPFFTKSTTWLGLGGGALAVAGLAVGGYFLFKPRDPTFTPGTITQGGSDGVVPTSSGGGGFRFGGSR